MQIQQKIKDAVAFAISELHWIEIDFMQVRVKMFLHMSMHYFVTFKYEIKDKVWPVL